VNENVGKRGRQTIWASSISTDFGAAEGRARATDVRTAAKATTAGASYQ
jgi:hypothetical protein